MLDESICHVSGVGSILSLLFYFLMENKKGPDLGMHYLPMTFYGFPGQNVLVMNGLIHSLF